MLKKVHHFIDITFLRGPSKFISVIAAFTIVANCNLSPSAIVFFCNFSVICCTVITVVIVSAVNTNILIMPKLYDIKISIQYVTQSIFMLIFMLIMLI